jgi:hypothetical protein
MTQLTATNHGITVTITAERSDIDIFEWFNMFKAAMVGLTFPESVVNQITEGDDE